MSFGDPSKAIRGGMGGGERRLNLIYPEQDESDRGSNETYLVSEEIINSNKKKYHTHLYRDRSVLVCCLNAMIKYYKICWGA